jgi:hypothetical protein
VYADKIGEGVHLDTDVEAEGVIPTKIKIQSRRGWVPGSSEPRLSYENREAGRQAS